MDASILSYAHVHLLNEVTVRIKLNSPPHSLSKEGQDLCEVQKTQCKFQGDAHSQGPIVPQDHKVTVL